MRPRPATSSPRRCPTRWRRRHAPSTAAPASSTSSRTTPATCSTSSSRRSSWQARSRSSTVVTNDDVAVQDSLYTAGRRGVGVTVLLEKIAGAHAEAGGSLADVTATAVKVNAQGRSMGLALTVVRRPGRGHPDLRARRRRGRSRDRHPRRAGPPSGAARAGRRDGRMARLADRLRPRPDPWRQGPRVRQRHGRHAAHRALHRLPQRRQDPRRAGDRHRALAGRQLHHEPRDGRLLGDAPASR